MLNGARKNLSNLVLNIVTYLWDTTLEVVSKPFLSSKDCVAHPLKMLTGNDRSQKSKKMDFIISFNFEL
jgi:hypothetical protein